MIQFQLYNCLAANNELALALASPADSKCVPVYPFDEQIYRLRHISVASERSPLAPHQAVLVRALARATS